MNEGVSGVKEASSTDGRVDEAADSQSIVIMAGTILVVRWDITTDPIFLSIATIDLFVILSSITLSWTRTMLRIYPALWGKPLYQNVSLDSSAKEIYLPSLLPLELNNRIHFEFNGSIITKLSSINKSCIPKEVEDIIQSVVDTLKTRNETLEIADEHPGVFAFLDNKRQADEIKSSDPHLAEYLEQIGKEQKANKRKRASSPQLRQPFPALSCKGVSVAPWHPKIQPPSQILLFFTTLERPVWLCASLI
ncbi:hypothetical protein Y032_0213g2302 [Ancylostoma ceylanicum]|uniref:Uncharacterized protein n=1 Tax=Ancylostoma ceylanicum TaxID=53326 RepID=A0A016SJP0_9BILA|nr:hypothetical protein Y032_0213g2302 [Ancylostoma ceylanicum]